MEAPVRGLQQSYTTHRPRESGSSVLHERSGARPFRSGTIHSRNTKHSSSAYEEAIGVFKTIPVWKDVDEQIRFCKQRISEIEEDEKAKAEAKRAEAQAKAEALRIAAIEAEKKRKKMTAIIASVGCACFAFIVFISFSPIFKHNYIIKSLAIYGVGFVFLLTRVIIPRYKYNTAIKTYESGNVIEAYKALVALNGYKDSKDKAKSIFDKYSEENNGS